MRLNSISNPLHSKIKPGVGTTQLLVCLACYFYGCLCSRPQTISKQEISTASNQAFIQEIVDEFTKEEHPFGSNRQSQLAQFLKSKLEPFSMTVTIQNFSSQTPNPAAMNSSGPVPLELTKKGQNVLAEFIDLDKPCFYLVGSHYDTKPFEQFSYLGANDSGSSSAALLLLAKIYSEKRELLNDLKCAPRFVWFDGEEAQLENWTDGESQHPAKIVDNTYGSRHMVDTLEKCDEHWCFEDRKAKFLSAMVLLDMIGSPNLKFSNDRYSSASLKDKFVTVLKRHDKINLWTQPPKYIEDDHIAFLRKGIPAINLIDFENLSHWHRHSDLAETLDIGSIELTVQLTIDLLRELE